MQTGRNALCHEQGVSEAETHVRVVWVLPLWFFDGFKGEGFRLGSDRFSPQAIGVNFFSPSNSSIAFCMGWVSFHRLACLMASSTVGSLMPASTS